MKKNLTAEQQKAHEIFNSFGFGKGKDYIVHELYFSGSATYWRLVWNEFQKIEP